MQLATSNFLLLLGFQRTVIGKFVATPSPSPAYRTITALNTQSSANTAVKGNNESYSKEAIWKPYTVTEFFETIQWFGPNRTYTESDGIPRLRFSPAPTISQPTMVSVVRSDVDDERCFFASYNPERPEDCYWFSATERPIDDYLAEHPETPCNAEMMTSLDVQMGKVKGMDMPAPCLYEYFCELDLKEEIILIHWASNTKENRAEDLLSAGGTQVTNILAITSPAALNRVKTFETSALTFRGRDLYQKSIVTEQDGIRYTFHSNISTISPSVLTGPFTFTYPTIYMAHRDIAVSRYLYHNYQTSWEGQLTVREKLEFLASTHRPAGIIPLRSDQVFSARPFNNIPGLNGNDYAQSVAQGSFRPPISYLLSREQTLPLNFANLLDPVPASVYFDARWKDCWGEQIHCGTITDDTYRPAIYIQRQFWNTFIPDLPCNAPNLVDPPIALTTIGGAETLVAMTWPQNSENAASTTILAQNQFLGIPSPSPGGNVQPVIVSATYTPRSSSNELPSSLPTISRNLGRDGGNKDGHGEIGREKIGTINVYGGDGKDQLANDYGILQVDIEEHGDGQVRGSRTNDKDGRRGSSTNSRGWSSIVKEDVLAVLAANIGAI